MYINQSRLSSDRELASRVVGGQEDAEFPKIDIYCTFGDPLSPNTWSGTPFNICTVLNQLGYLGTTVNCHNFANRVSKKLTSALSYLYYQGSQDHFRGKILTRAKSRIVEQKLALSRSSDILHFGFDHLPLSNHNDQRHYLIVDNTWHLLQSSNVATYGRRLVCDTEAIMRTVLHQMTHLFPIGEYLKDDLVHYYRIDPAKITAVGTGSNLTQPFYGEKDYENPTILFVAKHSFEIKGGDIVVQGFRIAHQKNPRLKLILAGRNEYKQQFGDIPGITTYGFISKEQLQDLFDSATLFAMPARSEPWGLVYLEAMKCKTPVIGLNRNALPEITQNGRFGFLSKEATPEAFSASLLDACSNHQRLRRMATEGQQYCLQNFTWERTVKKIISTIKHYAESPQNLANEQP